MHLPHARLLSGIRGAQAPGIALWKPMYQQPEYAIADQLGLSTYDTWNAIKRQIRAGMPALTSGGLGGSYRTAYPRYAAPA